MEMPEEPDLRWGILLTLYADRRSVFNQPPETKQRMRTATWFTRAMDELAIRVYLNGPTHASFAGLIEHPRKAAHFD